jgi:hypothetical protein
VPIVGGNEGDSPLMTVLTSRITKLEKLQEARMQATKTIRIQQWNITLWSQQKNLKKQFNFGDYVHRPSTKVKRTMEEMKTTVGKKKRL